METINITKSVEQRPKQAEYKERWPRFSDCIRWTAKVDLYHLNGTTNHIKIIMPVMNGGSEELHKYLVGWVNELTAFFMAISHYKITMGGIYIDGSEEESIIYETEKIPLGKVWVHNWPLGMWISPEDVKRGRNIIDEERRALSNQWSRGPYPFPYHEPGIIQQPKIY